MSNISKFIIIKHDPPYNGSNPSLVCERGNLKMDLDIALDELKAASLLSKEMDGCPVITAIQIRE